MMNLFLALNWGLGLEILKTLGAVKTARICAVLTQHDESSGDEWFNAVYDFGISRGFCVMDQSGTGFPEMRRFIQEREIDLMIIHSFMKKIPREVFTAPRYGSVNVHPSLLPKHRGRSPTHWVLKNGEKKTGLTCHFISEGIDEGDIINQAEVPVEKTDTIGSIIEKQKRVVPALLRRMLPLVTDKDFVPTPQPVSRKEFFR